MTLWEFLILCIHLYFVFYNTINSVFPKNTDFYVTFMLYIPIESKGYLNLLKNVCGPWDDPGGLLMPVSTGPLLS